MRYRAILAAVVLAGSVGVADAQQEPPAPPQGGATPAPGSAPGASPEGMPLGDMTGHPHGGMAMEHRGGMAMEHHGRGREAQAGFEIRMGEGRSLRVRCGGEPIRACIEAAEPVIDRITEAPGAASRPTGP
jgi:hypothetical protein